MFRSVDEKDGDQDQEGGVQSNGVHHGADPPNGAADGEC